MTTWWEAARNLVWPACCAGCGRPDTPLCPRCRAAVAGPAFSAPVNGWPLGFGVWAASRYRGVPARLLIAWKERGRHDLGPPLGAGLAAAVLACRARSGAEAEEWLLVPVPARSGARRRRGADLNRELARHAAAACGRGGRPPVRVLPALRHVRRGRDQADLDAAGRRANLAGALAVRRGFEPRLAGRACLVVDDIVTTGATAAEAARALTERGAQVVGVCCLSVTFRRPGVSSGADLH